MQIVERIDFEDFQPWSGAVDTWELLKKYDKLGELEQLLNDIHEDNEMSDTELNDTLWFESDWIFENIKLPHGDAVVVDEDEVKAYCEEHIGADLVNAEDGSEIDWSEITEEVNQYAEDNEIWEWFYDAGEEVECTARDLLSKWRNDSDDDRFELRSLYDYEEEE